MTCDVEVEDIEDMTAAEQREGAATQGLVLPTASFSKKTEASLAPSSDVPGTQRIWFKTFGCSHNVSDSEYMQGVLASYGYRFVPEEDRGSADLWLLNSCTVKDPSQAAFTNLVQKAQEDHRPLVVAGCVPQADRNLRALEGVSMLGVQQIDRVVEAVEQTLQGNTVRMLGKKGLPSLDLPKIRKNRLVEIVPLSTGCLGACTYCKTRHARGKLGSYEPEAITKRVKDVVREGVTEVWLSSEDTGAYGRDIGSSIAKLLRAVVPELPQDVMLRVGMTNPPFILEHLPAVAEALRHPNVYAFLHVPVQAGSNRTLKAMNREYTKEEFCQVVDYLQAHVPGVTIATDIICGFPGETEADMQETLDLMAHYKLAIVNISQFYPRPGTPAARMQRVPTDIVKDRSRRMTKLFYSFDPYTLMVGTEQKVWVNTEVSKDGRHTVGHTKNYTKVLLARNDALIGGVARVRITACERFHVEGEVLEWHTVPSYAAAKKAQEADKQTPHKQQARVTSRRRPRQEVASQGLCGCPSGGGCGGGTTTFTAPACQDSGCSVCDGRREPRRLQLPATALCVAVATLGLGAVLLAHWGQRTRPAVR